MRAASLLRDGVDASREENETPQSPFHITTFAAIGAVSPQFILSYQLGSVVRSHFRALRTYNRGSTRPRRLPFPCAADCCHALFRIYDIWRYVEE